MKYSIILYYDESEGEASTRVYFSSSSYCTALVITLYAKFGMQPKLHSWNSMEDKALHTRRKVGVLSKTQFQVFQGEFSVTIHRLMNYY